MKLLALFLLVSAATGSKWNPRTHPRWNLLDHENCGESYADRIIGGKKAQMGQYPWMAQLGYSHKLGQTPTYMCGGSLINPLYVLTAAHCIDAVNMAPLQLTKILLGKHNIDDVDCTKYVCPKEQEFNPAKIVEHDRFVVDTMKNDIALVRLDKPAQLNEFVSPICLPSDSLLDQSKYPSMMEVAGWGLREALSKSMSKNLYFVQLPVKDMAVCDARMGDRMPVGSGQLCVGGETGSDSCGGDSGGPLMAPYALNGPPKMYQFGIVSFGMVLCGGSSPAIYTEVRYFLNWILNNIAP